MQWLAAVIQIIGYYFQSYRHSLCLHNGELTKKSGKKKANFVSSMTIILFEDCNTLNIWLMIVIHCMLQNLIKSSLVVMHLT